MEFDPFRSRYMLLMRHPEMRLWAYSRPLNIALDLSFDDPSVSFIVVKVSCDLRVWDVSLDLNKVYHIDAEAQWVDTKIERAEDLNIFALARNQAKEILVQGADMTVVEHLEAIQKLQAPKQAELRERLINDRLRESKPSVVAQIIRVEAA